MADEASGGAMRAYSGAPDLRVLILGAGAVGSYLGARLLSAGADVYILARGARLKALAAKGLVVKSPLGNFEGAVKAAATPPADFLADIAVVACKAPALEGAITTLAPSLCRETRILPVLNGVAHIETLGRRFPQANVLGGLTHGALTLRDDDTVEHLTPFFSMLAGPLSAVSDPVVDRFIALLGEVGVNARVSGNIRQDMWNKLVFLATLAGATCLMRASIGTILSSKDGEDVILALLKHGGGGCGRFRAGCGRDVLLQAVPHRAGIDVHVLHAARHSGQAEHGGRSRSWRHAPPRTA